MILISVFLISLPVQKQAKGDFTIIFTYDRFTKVNFTEHTIKYSWFKKASMLVLSAKENESIHKSFTNNQISSLKGEFICTSDTMAIADAPEFKVSVYKSGMLISKITLDDYFDFSKKNSKDYKPAQFVNDLKNLLKNNASFKKVLKAANAYEEKNNFIRM